MIKNSIIFLATALLCSTTGAAQRLLPVSVSQFLQERSMRQHNGVQLAADLYRYVPSREIDGCEVVDAFVAIDNTGVITLLEQVGVNVNCVFDGFITAQIPVSRLEMVSRMHGVSDVEISRRVAVSTDSTMSVTHVNQVHNGIENHLPYSYDGSGVIVGVIDVGFDYQHRAFRSNDDPAVTRISRVYSTTDKTGHPARYNKVISLPGSVFMGNEIYRLTTDNTTNTHGTHTASIAAGSHVNGYGGMAPGAEIVLCAVSVLDGSMSAVEVTNCIRYIDSYADSVGKPCVMSLSVSTPSGPRDGQDYLSKAVKQTCGPGRIFVISAGNDGGRVAYAHRLATQASPLNVLFKYRSSSSSDSSYYYSGLLADVWMRQSSQTFYYKFHVLDQFAGKIVWESEQFYAKARVTTSDISEYFKFDSARDTIGYIEGTTSSSYSKYRLEVAIHNMLNMEYITLNGIKYGRYALGLSIYPRKQNAVEIDAWACNSGSGLAAFREEVIDISGNRIRGFYATPSDSCCIGTYAVGDSTISAGAYAARNSYYSLAQNRIITDNSFTVGDIAYFSSYQSRGVGPTGKALPTICAPGINVVAAGSRYSYFARGSINTVMAADGSYWGVMSGTSMAAPTVAGIIALWLQADPNLSVAEVNDILAQTAIMDRFTFGVNHERFGSNGKIDALQGLQLILKRKPLLKGDLNKDGSIDVADVTLMIDCVLNGMGNTSLMIADLDGDNAVDVSDVIILIQMVLNGVR